MVNGWVANGSKEAREDMFKCQWCVRMRRNESKLSDILSYITRCGVNPDDPSFRTRAVLGFVEKRRRGICHIDLTQDLNACHMLSPHSSGEGESAG